MKTFMGEDFLLSNGTAEKLFHDYAEQEPIFDFHCHLIPAEIAANKRYSTLTDIWLGGDHYKWRTMRANGVDEALVTGDADPYEKFLAWAGTIENLIGNPLYQWTHLELKRYFGIDRVLSLKTAKAIWEEANARLAEEGLSVKGILRKFRVHALGTTDDPTDSLEHHAAIAAGTAPIGAIETEVMPSFRPDRAIHIDRGDLPEYMERLGACSQLRIEKTSDVLAALSARLEYFVARGCRASDHALEYVPSASTSGAEADRIFRKALSGDRPSREEADTYRCFILSGLAREYGRRGIVMQLHLNCLRNINARMFSALGPDTGYDASHDRPIAEGLAAFLSRVADRGKLPRTILYSLNPKDYYPLATVMGGFQGGSEREGDPASPGKMQLGSAWWFCDHRDGMEEQLRMLANQGLLSRFVGMLTDSRSLLSYPRHEYFRRILCNLVGTWAENGELPADLEYLGGIVRDISFGNALRYFTGGAR